MNANENQIDRWALLCLALPLAAQETLSLDQAVQLALRQNKSLEASRALEKGADAHTRGARSGYYPSLNYSESATRSNNPVFVFSSLLTEHQFAAQNFQIGPLNRPDALDNFRSNLVCKANVIRRRSDKECGACGARRYNRWRRRSAPDRDGSDAWRSPRVS